MSSALDGILSQYPEGHRLRKLYLAEPDEIPGWSKEDEQLSMAQYALGRTELIEGVLRKHGIDIDEHIAECEAFDKMLDANPGYISNPDNYDEFFVQSPWGG